MTTIRRTMQLFAVAAFGVALMACATVEQHDDHDHGDAHGHDDLTHNDHAHDDHSHGDDDHGHDDHGHARRGGEGRLLVATSTGTLAVLDAHDGDLEAVFPHALPEGIVVVYSGPSGEFGYAVNRTASVVAVVDSGQILEEHDGHEDLHFGDIGVLGHVREGLLPSHFSTTYGLVGMYNDESGDITVFDEHRLRDDFGWSIVPARADHGAPVLLRDRLIVGYVRETFLEVMDYGGTVIQTFDGIERAHGQARIGRFSAFGAVGGVFVVTQTGDRFAGGLIPNPPDTPADARTGTLRAHPRLPHFVGNLGEGVVAVDPASMTSTRYALPAAPWRFEIDRSGHFVVVLGQDGVVYVLDADTFEIEASIAAVAPRDPNAPSGTPIPALTLGRRVAYVSDPESNHILVIDLAHGEIEDEIHVEIDGTITSIAAMITDGVVH
jgi:hypothetical protein